MALPFASQVQNIPATFWLIALSLMVTLTVNPVAGYAISQLRRRSPYSLLVFCLAALIFPALVSMVPGYLLRNDLGAVRLLLALTLPAMASGMCILIFKGFFDSLSDELFEAATLEGARTWRILSLVMTPMFKPLLLITAVIAFLGAYGGQEWARLVCQSPTGWPPTLQSAAFSFVIAGVPPLLGFLFWQYRFLRHILSAQSKS